MGACVSVWLWVCTCGCLKARAGLFVLKLGCVGGTTGVVAPQHALGRHRATERVEPADGQKVSGARWDAEVCYVWTCGH